MKKKAIYRDDCQKTRKKSNDLGGYFDNSEQEDYLASKLSNKKKYNSERKYSNGVFCADCGKELSIKHKGSSKPIYCKECSQHHKK